VGQSEVGGSKPEDFETITRRYVAANPMSRPSVGNKIRAVAEFAKILLTPAPDLSTYDKALNLPILRASQSSVDNQSWRETHAVPGAFGTTSAFNEGHIRVPSQNSGGLVLRDRATSVLGKEGGGVQNAKIPSTAGVA